MCDRHTDGEVERAQLPGRLFWIYFYFLMEAKYTGHNLSHLKGAPAWSVHGVHPPCVPESFTTPLPSRQRVLSLCHSSWQASICNKSLGFPSFGFGLTVQADFELAILRPQSTKRWIIRVHHSPWFGFPFIF